MDSLEFERQKFKDMENKFLADTNVYDMRLQCFVKGPLAKEGTKAPTKITRELTPLLIQVRFFNGECDRYSPKELATLKTWLQDVKRKHPQLNLEEYFTKTILEHKEAAQQNYPHSQVARIFKYLNPHS